MDKPHPITETVRFQQMNVWSLFQAMRVLTVTMEVVNLQVCLSSHVDWQEPLQAWAEDFEEKLSKDLNAAALNMARRQGLSSDEEDERVMALARVHGLLTGDAYDAVKALKGEVV